VVFAVTCHKCRGTVVLWIASWGAWSVDIGIFFWGGDELVAEVVRFAYVVDGVVGVHEGVRIGVVGIGGVGCVGAIFVNGVNDGSGCSEGEGALMVDCKADLHSVGHWVFIAGAKPHWIGVQGV